MNVLYFNKDNLRRKTSNHPPIRRPSENKDILAVYAKSPSNQDTLLASGDRDCSRCCRLCGKDTSLKYFKDSYVWEGAEERYDQLLYDCFGIRVTPSDCMICDFCVRCLRNTEKFRALVFAAFEQASASDIATYVTTSEKTVRTNSCHTNSDKSSFRPVKHAQNKRRPSELRRREAKKVWPRPETKSKRVNVQCEVCKQRYPIMVSNGECKAFTCSRCKKKEETKRAVCRKCNIAMPTNMVKEHMDLHAKAELRGKARPRQLKKQQAATFGVQHKEKLPGFKSAKKVIAAVDNLTANAKARSHGFSNDNIVTTSKKPCVEEPRQKTARNLDTEPTNNENIANECRLLFKNLRANNVRHNASIL